MLVLKQIYGKIIIKQIIKIIKEKNNYQKNQEVQMICLKPKKYLLQMIYPQIKCYIINLIKNSR